MLIGDWSSYVCSPDLCLAPASGYLSKKRCADRDLRSVERRCLYLVSLLFLPPHLQGSKKGERRRRTDAASPRECAPDQCAWSIASRARTSDRNCRHPLIPCARSSPSTSMVAQNHFPSSRPRQTLRPSSPSSPSMLSSAPTQRTSTRAPQRKSPPPAPPTHTPHPSP